MIDTVILTIPKEKLVPIASEVNWELQSQTKAYTKFVKNPTPSQLASGSYFPRLTGYNRGGVAPTLKIEFSAPKLLYKNNLDELENSDFEKVVEVLRARLKTMGLQVFTHDIENATVAAVHYSKNIEINDGYTAQYVIGELSKINLNKRFDLTRVRYMNNGQSICAYSKAHSFVIYDKIADLQKGQKRAIDKDQTQYQPNLFDGLKGSQEILRLEVRLSEKRKMNALFKQFGFKENPTFKDVFLSARSKKVVGHYWDTMIAGESLVLFTHHLKRHVEADHLSKTKRKSKNVHLPHGTHTSRARRGRPP